MRAILHAKFDDHLPKSPCTFEDLPCASISQLRDSSVEDFESAMTKAQAACVASKQRATPDCYLQNAYIARHR